MDRTALYIALLESFNIDIESDEVGNYYNYRYKLMSIDSLINLMQDILMQDKDSDPKHWSALDYRCHKLRCLITEKLSKLDQSCS